MKRNTNVYSQGIIFTDSQAAIKAIAKPRQQSGQQIIKAILNIIDDIHKIKPDFQIHLEWVPGHTGITGNEKADQAAKIAAATNTSEREAKMKSVQNREIKTEISKGWQTEWNKGQENARRLRKMSRRTKTDTGVKIYQQLKSRKHIAWITRLRTEHCSLNKYLHRQNSVDDPYCECRDEFETISHYLLRCELFERERDALRWKVGAHGMRVETLLGDPKIVHHTLQFIEETKRFNF
jgi:hypothetical protein